VSVYLAYMAMVSLAFALYCGAVGFMTSFMFTRIIYNAVKIDRGSKEIPLLKNLVDDALGK